MTSVLFAFAIHTGASLPVVDWNATAAELSRIAAEGGSVRAALQREQPRLAAAVSEIAQHPDLLSLWGICSNFDELAKAVVVDPAIVDTLNSMARAPLRDGARTHAGVQHTFGYFFSTLATAYGYKRERWTKADIELGFGLPRGVLGIAPSAGTLFENATYFAGRIALADDSRAQRMLAAVKERVAPSLVDFPYAALQRRRLVETLTLANARIELRSDFVFFGHPVAGSTSVAWLIYSVLDSRIGHRQLITAFPVGQAFVDSKTASALLGEKQTIMTQYNAFVAGLSDSAAAHLGTRTLTRE